MLRTLLFIFTFLCSPSTIPLEYSACFETLPGWNAEEAVLEPFGNGMTNRNYRLTLGEFCYFVRVGSLSRDSLGTDYERERTVALFAAAADLAPPVLVENRELQLMVMPFIPSRPLNIRDPATLEKALILLKQLHATDPSLPYAETPEGIIQKYLVELERLDVPLTRAQEIILNARPSVTITHFVPCHLDVQSGNMLDDGERLWFIDWEYGALSDPFFDLATLASTNRFNLEELDTLLALYAPHPSPELRHRFLQLVILADLRWALWSIIQTCQSNLHYDYKKEADHYFRQAAMRLFALHNQTHASS